jgi:hypothetical protein
MPTAATHYLLDVIIIVVKDLAPRRQLRILNHSGGMIKAEAPRKSVMYQHAGE